MLLCGLLQFPVGHIGFHSVAFLLLGSWGSLESLLLAVRRWKKHGRYGEGWLHGLVLDTAYDALFTLDSVTWLLHHSSYTLGNSAVLCASEREVRLQQHLARQ